MITDVVDLPGLYAEQKVGVFVYVPPKDFMVRKNDGAWWTYPSSLTERAVHPITFFISSDRGVWPPIDLFTSVLGVSFSRLEIHRPPVVLVHGFWRDQSAWDGLELLDDPRFLIA